MSRRIRKALFCGPGLTWLVLFSGLPLLLMVGVSFLSRSEYGQVTPPLTFDNYRRLAGWDILGFDPVYPRVLLRTLLAAAGVTVLCLLGALPLVFFINARASRSRTIALALVVIPFWTNLLIRTYAWQVLLGAEGPLARLFSSLGWIPRDTGLYPGWFAVILVMVCDFLPFMALPLYASVEKLDWSLAEAAADLGASPVRVFWHAILPQLRPGIVSGILMVFLPATGQFVIPDLLGGGRITLLGNLVQQQFGVSRDWPFGAAAACLTLVALLVALVISRGWSRRGVRTEDYP